VPAGPGQGTAPDTFAPGAAPWSPGVPSVPAIASPAYAGTAPVGTQFFYSSGPYQGTVALDLGTTIQVTSLAWLPARYPFKLLLEWGTPNQEVVVITSAPTGNGPYTFSGVLRGMDGSSQVTHLPGAAVNHGVSQSDFSQGCPVYNVCSTLFAGGADPTGTIDSSPAIQAAVNACLAAGGAGVVQFPSGFFKMLSTVTGILSNNVTLTVRGMGHQATILSFQGMGDCLRIYDSTPYSGANMGWRTSVLDLSIDGTYASTGGPSHGLHIGDMGFMKLDVYIANFTYGTGSAMQNATTANASTGLLLENTVTWTEEVDICVLIYNCTRCAVLNVTTGYDSFGYGNYDFKILANPGQDGIVLSNGALLYHGVFRIRGNMSPSGSSTPGNVVLRMIGKNNSTGPSNGKTCSMLSSTLIIQCEVNSGTTQPGTFWMDSTNYAFIGGCTGILDFAGGTGAFLPAVGPQQITFAGMINGDSNLTSLPLTNTNGGQWQSANAPVIYSTYPSTSPNVPTAQSDFSQFTLTGNATINLNYSGYNEGQTLGVAQRVTVGITQAASGGPYTVTWPVNATPTITSPTVIWAGGVAPQQSAGASTTDLYFLQTYDGKTWFGQAVQLGLVNDTEQFACLTAAYTLSNVTTAVPLFNSTTNGALTVQAATTYFFEAEFDVTGLSATSHTIQLTFGGTATYTSVKYMADVLSPFTAGTPGTWATALFTAATVQTLVAAGTNTSFACRLRGVIRANAAGTVIPQITQETASAAAVVSANSWFRIWNVGSNTVADVGNWS
jgi:hypothetical protein